MSESRNSKATQYKNKYNADKYDSLRIVVPKGCKELVEARAKELDTSVNGLVGLLLRADMGLDEWPQKEEGTCQK